MKAAIYCRLSKEDEDKIGESESIQNQKSMLLQYAIEKGFDIYQIYSDEDYSGIDRNRPAFNSMLQAASEHQFDVVLAKTQSRFTRDMELVEKYLHGKFMEWGIRFIAVVDHVDTNDTANKKSRQINGLINEWYLEDLSTNVRSVLDHKRKEGLFIGSFARYGYCKDPNAKGKLIIDPEAAEVVRRIFSMALNGIGAHRIARILNDEKIPSPTAYKQLHGIHYRSALKNTNAALWSSPTVYQILHDQLYIGNMVQGKYGSVSYKTKQNKPRPKEEWYRVEGTHEPIIDRELWDRVQSMVAEKAKPFTVGTIGLFARKARCMNCGYTMRSNKQTDGRHYLQCSNRHVAKDACIGSFISVKKLEQAVISELNKLSQEYLDKDELEQNVEFHSNVKEKKTALETQLATYQKKIEEDAKVIRELYLDKVKGILSENDFLNLSKDFTNDRERLEKLVIETQKQLDVIERKIQTGDNRRQLIEQYTNLEHLDRETVETLIDYILVGKRIPGTRNVPIEIHWNF